VSCVKVSMDRGKSAADAPPARTWAVPKHLCDVEEMHGGYFARFREGAGPRVEVWSMFGELEARIALDRQARDCAETRRRVAMAPPRLRT
jgi:hypothetical protein